MNRVGRPIAIDGKAAVPPVSAARRSSLSHYQRRLGRRGALIFTAALAVGMVASIPLHASQITVSASGTQSISYNQLVTDGGADTIIFTNNSTGPGGTLDVTSPGTVGALGDISLTDTTGNTISTIDAGGAGNVLNLNGSVTSGGGVNNMLVLQNGTVALGSTSNSADFTGGTLQIGNGTAPSDVNFSLAANLPAANINIALDTGGLNYTGGGTATIANGITTVGLTSNSINAGGGTLILNGTIANSEGLLKFTTGTFVLASTSNYVAFSSGAGGTMQIGDGSNAATLQFSSSANLPHGDTLITGPGSYDSVGGQMLALDQSTVQYTGTSADSIPDDLSAVAGTTNIINANGQPITLSGEISGTGNLELTDGTFFINPLTIQNTAFSGALDLNNARGAVSVQILTQRYAQSGFSPSSIIFDGGTLVNAEGTLPWPLAPFTVNSAGGTIDAAGASLDLADSISGSGTLLLTSSLANSGTIFVQNSNATFDGAFAIGGGVTVQIGNSAGFGSGALTIEAGGGTLQFGSSNLTVANNLQNQAGNSLNFDLDGQASTWSGNINSAGPLVIESSSVGNGSLNLTGNDAVGDAAVNAGNLTIGPTGALSFRHITIGAGAVLNGSGTLNYSVGGLTSSLVTDNGTLNISTLNLALNINSQPTLGQYVIANYAGGTFDPTTTFQSTSVAEGTLPTGWAIDYGGTVLYPNSIVLVVPLPIFAWHIGGSAGDGSGNWDTSTSNWTTNGVSAAWTNGSVASIGTASGTGPYTVTIDEAGLSASGITFNPLASGQYTVAASSGDNLTLSGMITLNADASIAAPIVGTGRVGISGAHTLALSAANSYSGGTVIANGATVSFSAGGSLDAGGQITNSPFGTGGVLIGTSGGTLQYTAASVTINNSLALAGNATIDANGFGGASAETWSGVISGTGNLTAASGIPGGTLILTGANTYTGSTIVNSGTTLLLSGAGSIAASSGVTLSNGATFDVSQASAGPTILGLNGTGGTVNLGSNTLNINTGQAVDTFAGVIQDGGVGGGVGGALSVSGTLNLLGRNTYSGGTTVAGIIRFNNNQSFGTGAINFSGNNPEIQFAADGLNLANNMSVTGNSLIIYSGTTGTTGVVWATGTTGTTGLTGTTLGTTSGLTLTLNQAATNAPSATHAQSAPLESLAGTGMDSAAEKSGASGSATITLNGGTPIYYNAIIDMGGYTNETYSGSIISSANGGGVVVIQNGELNLTGNNSNTFTSGTLQIGNNNSGPAAVRFATLANLPAPSVGINLAGGTLQFGADSLNVANPLSGSGTIDAGGFSNETLSGLEPSGQTARLTIQNGHVDLTNNMIASSLQIGNGVGTSIVEFQSVASLSNNIWLNDGTLQYGSDNLNVSAPTTLWGSGTIDTNGFGSETYSGNISGGYFPGPATLNLQGAGGTHTISGIISDAPGMNTLALNLTTGTWNLTAVNTYSGPTTVGDGTHPATLTLAAGGALASNQFTINPGAVLNGGGTLNCNVAANTSPFILDQGTLDISGLNLALNLAGPQTVSQFVIVNHNDAGASVIGSQFASVSNTPLGWSIDYAGTAQNPNSIVLLLTAPVRTWMVRGYRGDGSGVWDTSTFNWGGTPWANGDIASIGNGGAGGTITVSSAISTNGITFNPLGYGQYTLVGGAGGTLSFITGSLTMDASAVINAPIVAGNVIVEGTHTLTLSGANTYTGQTLINSGTLAIAGNGNIANSSAVAIGNGATLDISRAAGGTAINNLSGTGGIVALGGETLTIQAAFMATNSFAGIIRDGGLGGGTGGTLDLSGGTLNLSGQNTYTGATILDNATLALSGTGSIANSSAVEFNNFGNLDISQSTTGVTIRGLDDQTDPYPSGDSVSLGASTLTINIASGTDIYSGVIRDGGIGGGAGGSIVVSGAGTLVLGNANTYTGGTTINNGTTVDYAGYAALGTGGLTLNGGTVKNTSGSLLLVSGPVTLGWAGGIIDTNGEAASLTAGIHGPGGLTITGGGALTLTGPAAYTGPTSIQSGSLIIGTGGSINGTSALTIAAGAELNLASIVAGNGVTIDYGTNPDPAAIIKGYIASGQITAPAGYTIGYADGASGEIPGLHAGQEKIMVTLPGDATLTGRVTLSDFTLFLQNYGMTSGAQWYQGDFDHDGKVNLQDFSIFLSHYGQSLSSGLSPGPSLLAAQPAFAAQATPEPAALACLAPAAILIMLRRRRKTVDSHQNNRS